MLYHKQIVLVLPVPLEPFHDFTEEKKNRSFLESFNLRKISGWLTVEFIRLEMRVNELQKY